MIDPTRQTLAGKAGVRDGVLSLILKRRTLSVALAFSLLATIYWGFVASDRYVSEAHVVLQRTDYASSAGIDFSSLLAGGGATGKGDQLLLRDTLLALDTLKTLDAKLNLRGHYSNPRHDLLSRMWSQDTEDERFYRYYLSRVSVELDDYSGILVIKAQAYEPKMAQDIARMLSEVGERRMNALSHELAQEQVDYLEKQVTERGARAIAARQALLDYQNKKGLVAPQSTAESLAGIINTMESQLAELGARRSAMLGYLAPSGSSVVELDYQISAIKQQIETEKSRLASSKAGSLNRTVEEYQRLQMTAEFAQDVYKSALIALEKGRVEATRTLKKVSVLQSPNLPQYPLEPKRIYNTLVFVLVTLLLAGIVHLMAAIIRDHKD